jgi:hypothetical protein
LDTLGILDSRVNLGGSGVVGPLVGFAVVIIVTLLLLVGAVVGIESELRRLNLPVVVRQFAGEAKVAEKIGQERLNVEKQISKALETELLNNRCFEQLVVSVRKQLMDNADRMSVMIT